MSSAACGPVAAAVGAPPGADMAYLRISTFNRRTVDLFEEQLRALRAAGASAVVLDLRNNGGGYFPAGVQVRGFRRRLCAPPPYPVTHCDVLCCAVVFGRSAHVHGSAPVRVESDSEQQTHAVHAVPSR